MSMVLSHSLEPELGNNGKLILINSSLQDVAIPAHVGPK